MITDTEKYSPCCLLMTGDNLELVIIKLLSDCSLPATIGINSTSAAT